MLVMREEITCSCLRFALVLRSSDVSFPCGGIPNSLCLGLSFSG